MKNIDNKEKEKKEKEKEDEKKKNEPEKKVFKSPRSPRKFRRFHAISKQMNLEDNDKPEEDKKK